MSKAEERAKAYENGLDYYHYTGDNPSVAYKAGYEQAEKDILAIVKEYLEKGLRCVEQSDESQIHAFWDGFHNCAENILRELEEEK